MAAGACCGKSPIEAGGLAVRHTNVAFFHVAFGIIRGKWLDGRAGNESASEIALGEAYSLH
jgi:hypothetical protein